MGELPLDEQPVHASHCDLYDGGYTALEGHGQPKNMIPWDTVADFFKEHMK